MNILITSAGRRVSLIRAFQKELRKIDPNGKVLASDANPILSAACQVADKNFKVPRIKEENYIETLLQKCIQEEVNLIIPTIDTELLLLSENVELFQENKIKVLISSLHFVEKCRNKRVIHDFFKSKKIRVAKEYDKNDFVIPMFIKPYDGSRSVDTYLIKSKEDLQEYHFENEKLMFLEYLDHETHDEFTCDLYYDKNNELKCIVPRKRIEVRDGEVNKGLTQRIYLINYLKERLKYIDGAVGCLTAQFFVNRIDETEIYGIEINPRFGGGYPLSYLAGANFPKWIIQEYLLGEAIEPQFDSWEDNLLMIRYDDEILVHGYQS